MFDAVYADVLDPNVTATVSVETPSGEYLVQNGVTYKDLPLGEYDVTLTEYGNYIVYYKRSIRRAEPPRRPTDCTSPTESLP
ncbi:MAG: hypothetical protein ACLUSP_02715 [Christensenellales bacterium]